MTANLSNNWFNVAPVQSTFKLMPKEVRFVGYKKYKCSHFRIVCADNIALDKPYFSCRIFARAQLRLPYIILIIEHV